jgi:signal peptidase I
MLEGQNEKNQEPTKSNEIEKSILGMIGLFFVELVKVAVLAGVTIFLVRYFLFKPFYVKGQSMEPTFYEKEYLIIDEISYRFREIERGEVVVFRAPYNRDDFYLKRVVGLPGERLKISENKIIIFNSDHPQGIVVEEGSYLAESTPGASTVTLGPEQYYVLGDNRDASFDSRRFGPVNGVDIIGRAWFRGWPFNRITTFDTPQYNL